MIEKTNVVIYSKQGCCLCEKAKAVLLKVKNELPFNLQEIDISQDPELFEKYQYVIPVVAIDGKDIFVSKISEFRFRKFLLNKTAM